MGEPAWSERLGVAWVLVGWAWDALFHPERLTLTVVEEAPLPPDDQKGGE